MRSTRELGAGRPSNARAGPRPEARGTLRTLLQVGSISGLIAGRRSLYDAVSIRHAEVEFLGGSVGITVGAIGGTVMNVFLSKEDEQGLQ